MCLFHLNFNTNAEESLKGFLQHLLNDVVCEACFMESRASKKLVPCPQCGSGMQDIMVGVLLVSEPCLPETQISPAP